MSKNKLSKTLPSIITAISLIIVLLLVWLVNIYKLDIWNMPTSDFLFAISVSAIVAALIGGVILIVISAFQRRSLEKQKKSLLEEQRDLQTVTTITRSIIGRVSLAEQPTSLETPVAEKEVLDKALLELDKQRLELEEQQQSIGWQKEAVELVEASPNSAIVLAWVGIEQELQRAISRLGLLTQKTEEEKSSTSKNIRLLLNENYIDQETFNTLKVMQDERNIAVYALKERTTNSRALTQVQRAILLAQQISAIQKNTSSQV